MTRRVHRSEEGAALLMALVFLTVGAIVTAALLSFADTNFRTTVAVRDQGKVQYAADAAVEAAIDAYRNGTACGSLPAPPTVNDITGVTVTCTEDVVSGSTATNQPKLAVIARPTNAAEPGIVTESSEVTRVRGGLYSHQSIDTSGGPGGGGSFLDVVGPVTAMGSCETNRITSTPSPDCNRTMPYSEGDDPGYAAAVTTAPPIRSVPSCPATGPVVFQPGSYVDGATLNALFTSCAGRVFHFPSATGGAVGVYYFDFADTTAANHVWTIDNKDTLVVGGTLPAGQTLATIASVAEGGRCDEDAPGVQFVFGNDSRLLVEAGDVELCAQNDSTNTNQEIAVYGVKTGETIPPAPTQQTGTFTAGAASSSPSTQFTPVDNAKASGGGVATAALVSTASATRTATLTLSDIDAIGIPAGATIDSAVLKVTHRETVAAGNINQLDLAAVVTALDGTTTSFTVSRNNSATSLRTDTLTLPNSFKDVTNKLTDLKIDYTASTALTNATNLRSYSAVVDSIVLEVTYTPAVVSAAYLRAQTGCITTAPYSHSSGSTCALIRTEGNFASLSVHGTVYAPLSALDIELVNASYQVFGRGIVVRHLRSVVTASSVCGTAPIPDSCYAFQLPTATTSVGDVLFVATLDSRTRLRALVRFNGSSAPTIKSWSVAV